MPEIRKFVAQINQVIALRFPIAQRVEGFNQFGNGRRLRLTQRRLPGLGQSAFQHGFTTPGRRSKARGVRPH